MKNGDDLEWLSELEVLTNGTWYASISGKGIPESIADGTIKPMAIQVDASRPIYPIIVRFGATVNLGNFESARIEVHVNSVGWVSDSDAILEWTEVVANEMLEREVASVKGKKRKKKPLPDAPESVKAITLGMQYGLTLNLGSFESRKVDVGAFVPTMPSLLVDAWNELGKFVGSSIESRVKKIRNGK